MKKWLRNLKFRLVSVDTNGVSYNLVEAIRQKLANNRFGIEPLKVVFSAIHTHTAPAYPRYGKTAKCGLYHTFRSLLEKELPEGKKYLEKTNLLTNTEIITAAGDQCPVDLVRWVKPESDLNDPKKQNKADVTAPLQQVV